MMRALTRLGRALGLVASMAGYVSAQPAGPIPVEPSPKPSGMPELTTDCAGAEEFGGTPLERGGFCLSLEEKYVSLRTLSEQALKENPKSFRALFLAGVAQHLGEGNLPRALSLLHEAEERFVEMHGERPPEDQEGTFVVLRRIYLELVYVHGEMDHHEEKIRYVDLLRERLGYDYEPLKSWPLLKLERFDEAKRVALDAISRGDEGIDGYWKSVGLTALCAIESELRNREKAYEACSRAAQPYIEGDSQDGGVALSNAASAALEMGKFDEAERLFTESSRRMIEGTINPWGRLAHLYLRQGRFSEALGALREMKSYRLRRPSYFEQQDQTDAELTGAVVLAIAGLAEDAVRITGRAVHRPDRQGTSSAAFDQNYGGALLIDRALRRDLARRTREEASWSPFKEKWQLRAKAWDLELEAWINGRKAASILARNDRLATTLRPECPGSLELPNWLDAEVIGIAGPGVSLEAISAAESVETLPPALARPIFLSFRAEAHLLAGDDEEALEAAEEAIKTIGSDEALIRARTMAIAAEAARREDQYEKALTHYAAAIAVDPGVIRRLGFSLPVRIVAADSEASQLAQDYLEDSPYFEVDPGGLLLAVDDGAVRLSMPDGSQLAAAIVGQGSPEPEALARRIAKAAHFDLFVPNVDVTQADVRSLDGGLNGGGRATERAKSILEEVVE